jgi:CRP-like cAMP-binding protein
MANDDLPRFERRLARLRKLTAGERSALASLPLVIAEIPANRDIVRQGERPTQSCLIVEGFTAMHKVTPEGRRQILSLSIPGDMPDVQTLYLGIADSGLVTLTRSVIAFMPHAALRDVIKLFPSIGDLFWHLTLVDASMFREWIANIGQRDARARVAHLFCEIMVRMKAAGLSDGSRCYFPLTQAELAEATGVSAVHMNRTLQSLRQGNLVSMLGEELVVHDWRRLVALAGFDPTYLHLEPSPA